MLHEFSLEIPYAEVDEAIEKLNAVGIYYISYDAPIELVTTDNGYDFTENQDAVINLMIYAEDDGLETQPAYYLEILPEVLGVGEEQIRYQLLLTDSWQQPFEDVNLGNGWIIGLPDHEKSTTSSHQYLWFDPQGAFGTGLHGTTQDCLTIILKHDFRGQSAADLGTGSGILSIAAAVKGATAIQAIDIERVEREIQYNANLNGVTCIRVEQADLLEGEYRVSPSYDWIFINIGGDEAVQMMKRHNLLEGYQGNLLISGLVEWNAGEVVTLLEKFGFRLMERLQSNEWVTIHFIK
ncbi:50S ribosomal protein L11 methyltransferase [Ammoniphilus sp. CFH 90114]|uniref:50S ribosomal protein L11 methyltransferase n=1 Tax=Ammoniphilus sp. CFH 90114 TaxID=2493665 RepID=UPI00100FEB5A|nr:50S ribosomal protein L11 methyltransferase [Ammoniphilus sp. CFH 90114]RXT15271.1 50S ribosomal protein L11 methyltransferase [Ammoniphilus sp. CFH 90114]